MNNNIVFKTLRKVNISEIPAQLISEFSAGVIESCGICKEEVFILTNKDKEDHEMEFLKRDGRYLTEFLCKTCIREKISCCNYCENYFQDTKGDQTVCYNCTHDEDTVDDVSFVSEMSEMFA